MISGEDFAFTTLRDLLATRFEITFEECADFLGTDLSYDHAAGTFEISMKTFTDKFLVSVGITKPHPYPVFTPGLTNMKIIRSDDAPRAPTPDPLYRNKTGSMNWLTMGLRFDLNYATKELSRVADNSTLDADYLMQRSLQYLSQTSDSRLRYVRDEMLQYVPPATRRKPTDLDESIYSLADSYNIDDGIPQPDDQPVTQDYLYPGHQMVCTVYSDTDLGGQIETRQSTTGIIMEIDGAIVHWAAKTEKLVMTSTTKAEFVGLTRANALGKYVQSILEFYGNELGREYYLYTDSQTAEHLATQPNMSEAGRAIDIRFHSIRQDYVEGKMRVGGVSTHTNRSDIGTKYLAVVPHLRHAEPLFPNQSTHGRKAAETCTLDNNGKEK
jgi:hypothetical protein